jgi:class 3 adenylate cyclase/tetratricopeptide (TPR) repeat protein
VTVLFCDVTGSTALGESLDPEALRALLAGYFERMKSIVERHGGVVEKFIGDAVMAVFGLPAVHEDDALRALRAAAEMQEAFPELGIEGRIGVNTGEVVTGTEERLATGDAVNVAARLEQAALPGEILLGEATLRLARDAVQVEPVEALTLKGKREPVPAWRLISASAVPTERRLDSELVGREQELQTLAEAWERLRADDRCELLTVVGSAGVGKSRLVAEFLAGIDAAVVRGRCLSYGEGITYWPVVEVLKQLEPDRSRLELDPTAAEALGVLLGEEGTSSTDEIAWAFRKLLEAVAAERPLVAVVDDIQWGEEAFLDLVEHVAFLSTGAPILLLCIARPELLDRRGGWGGVVRLEPLAADETERLIDALVGGRDLRPAVRERILVAAGGNPLFVEEMAAMLAGSEDGEVAVPPTIQALLAARLDQLETGERTVLEHGAIEGEVFHRGAVQALTPEERRLTTRLTALVRRELVRPDRAQLAGEDAFRFRHLLIRDAAYHATPKVTRAELHVRFATWLERVGVNIVELDEIVGHHLEQSCRYRTELGVADPALADRAAARLAAAGRRAMALGDVGAAENLLARAADLVPLEARDVELELDLADALFWQGRLADCEALLGEVAARAAARGDRRAELLALLYHVEIRYWRGSGDLDELRSLADEAIPAFEAAGDHKALMRAWNAAGVVEMEGSRFGAMQEAFERAVVHARRAGDRAFALAMVRMVSSACLSGPTPVEEVLRWLEQPENAAPTTLGHRARLEAMQGRFEPARSLGRQAQARAEELGEAYAIASGWGRGYFIETLAGDTVEAERRVRRWWELIEQMGESTWLSTPAGYLAHALCALGAHAEAEEWSRRCEELASSVDVHTQMLWRQARAKALAHRGELAEGERLVREAVALAEPTDMLNAHAEALMDLAEVLTLAQKDASAELEQALALYERKGNVVMAERARAHLAELAS